MNSDPEVRTKALEKQILFVSIIDVPASIMLGLGLYAKFAADGDAFHPLLNNDSVVNSMLVAGAAMMLWGGYKVFTLARDKARLSGRAK